MITLRNTPKTLHPKLSTPHPKLSTLNPKLSTLNSKLSAQIRGWPGDGSRAGSAASGAAEGRHMKHALPLGFRVLGL